MKLAVGFIVYSDLTAPYLADFLPSLEEALRFLAPTDYQVYAWDNSREPEAVNRRAIEDFNSRPGDRAPRRPIDYFTAGKNFGFSRAYNILIDRAREQGAQYFLAINPDTLIEPEAIRELAACLDNNSSLGSVSPKMLRWDFSNKKKAKIIDSLGLILKPGLAFSRLSEGEEDKVEPTSVKILGPDGAAGLYRLNALVKIAEYQSPEATSLQAKPQYFDERFFMYKEDCDLVYRLFLAGYGSRLVPTAVIYHARTAAAAGRGWWSEITSRGHKSREVRAWSFRNQHLLYVKYWSLQSVASRLRIAFRMVVMSIFALIFERFLLREYKDIFSSK